MGRVCSVSTSTYKPGSPSSYDFLFGLRNANSSGGRTVAARWGWEVLWLILSTGALAVCVRYTHNRKGSKYGQCVSLYQTLWIRQSCLIERCARSAVLLYFTCLPTPDSPREREVLGRTSSYAWQISYLLKAFSACGNYHGDRCERCEQVNRAVGVNTLVFSAGGSRQSIVLLFPLISIEH